MFKPLAVALLALPLLVACGEPEDTHPGQPVTHRRQAFRELLKTSEPIGVMLRTKAYDATKYQQLLADFMAKREAPWQYFGADTLYPPSRARPEIWSQPEAFEAAKKEFLDASWELSQLGADPGRDRALAAYRKVEDTCERCHTAFKNK
ncbi:c-type cytochrome [Derxia gummosa]|uniref:C-type cytochrome n=1 Tax=Derxia gummosa DSM 723 TaxID=1121388 RepID=A0A8B6X2Q8_9BURK|nr:cytochrome c [Derxia gummosa]